MEGVQKICLGEHMSVFASLSANQYSHFPSGVLFSFTGGDFFFCCSRASPHVSVFAVEKFSPCFFVLILAVEFSPT